MSEPMRALQLYREALERGDFATVVAILWQAERDPELFRLIAEFHQTQETPAEVASEPPAAKLKPRRGITEMVRVIRDPSPNGLPLKPDDFEEDSDMNTTYSDVINRGKYRFSPQFITALAAALIFILLGAVVIEMIPVRTITPLTSIQSTQQISTFLPTSAPRLLVNTLPLPVGGQLDQPDDNAATFMRSAGMTWMKWQMSFNASFGSDALLSDARERIDWAHQNGFNILLSIDGQGEQLGQMGTDYFPKYADFVGQIAALHPDAIEVWSETNLDLNWPIGQFDAASYVDLLRQTYQAIKASDSHVMVISGAPSPTDAEAAFPGRIVNDDHFLQGMVAAGALNYLDCVGAHYDEGIVAPDQQSGDSRDDFYTRYFLSMVDTYGAIIGGQKPLCFTELGYFSPDGLGTAPLAFSWAANNTVRQQAEWLRDAVRIGSQTTNAQIALMIVFNVNFNQPLDIDPTSGYAIIRPDHTCPACDAIASLRSDHASLTPESTPGN